MGEINNIKSCLLELNSFDDTETFSKLQEEVRRYIGEPGIAIGITPLYTVNERFVFSSTHNVNSSFLKNLISEEEKETVCKGLQEHYRNSDDPVVVQQFSEDNMSLYPWLQHLQQQGWKSVIICPLKNYNRLIGTLEILSDKAGLPSEVILRRLDPALPLFELALNRSWATLDASLDKIIKEHFTAIQSSVEWRFTEAAVNYLLRSEEDEDARIETIRFDNVFPLYGAIDIRNSSAERNRCIQLDMLEQLTMASEIISKAYWQTGLPLLDEMNFRIRKCREAVAANLSSDEELSISHFLSRDIADLLQHLKSTVPSLADEITRYFTATTSPVDMLYHHRRKFDESITYLNKTIARFIDKQQKAAQLIYPHYFERFVTDGVDFNMYVGQSISPNIPFSDFYLKNLKIWQLITLAKAAQLSAGLLKQMPVELQTTQLILAHNYPICISFRQAERKFDVEGAYNIRYEIMKKRIDKVHIKPGNERLTQPHKIAIVYTQQKEADEYREYIEYLIAEGLLEGDIEQFELEDLQGLSGLKAIRVAVKLNARHELKTETQNLLTVKNPRASASGKQQ